MAVQFRFPKDVKWLYPQNQAFAEDKFAGKDAEPFHWKEVIHNFKKLEMLFLTPQWIGLFAVLGVVALLFVIGSVVWLIMTISNPPDLSDMAEMVDTRFERKMLLPMPIIFVASFLVSGGMAMGFLTWAFNSAKYLKYPTPVERHYRQLLDKGKVTIGLVERVQKVDEKFTRIKFSTKNRTAMGQYETISSVAKSLKEGDKVVVFKQSDYAVML